MIILKYKTGRSESCWPTIQKAGEIQLFTFNFNINKFIKFINSIKLPINLIIYENHSKAFVAFSGNFYINNYVCYLNFHTRNKKWYSHPINLLKACKSKKFPI
ncbi:hypothetical protein DA803_01950 [[Mycoplasma] phocae]|uniref:Uncharacterized protein n=1 Tax=[Mycoplasma] phocae TaxID=142651 RepID=A0A2Z5IRD5_9BACT|nr:hypothetical protein [[Mycoplasma] phocae]AXE60846.1 hypothetical protein DA803_01950 [[Mycoplasma] phocae]